MRTLMFVCAVGAAILSLQAVSEVQVNVRTSGNQANAAVAIDPRGGGLVVWSSYYTTAGRSNDILARQLDPNGVPVGEEFIVNVVLPGNQTNPAVAINGRSERAIVWQGAGPEEDIFLRLYDPNAVPVTEELLVNLRTDGRQLFPRVAAGEGETFVVVWESREATVDGDRTFVYAQRFDPNGTGIGGEILVDPGLYDCRYPDVAVDALGNFAVTWLHSRSNHPIMARLFDPNGVPHTDVFQVNTTRISSVTRPSLAMNSLGYFVITWDGDPNRAADDDIHARLYDPNGVARGEPFFVNTIRDGARQWPQVAINDANEFVIVWEGDSGDPNTVTNIYARRFGADGEPRGEEFRLNTHTLDRQRYADVAMAADGSFFAVWESNGQDGSGYGIFLHAEPPPDPDEPIVDSNEPLADPNEPRSD